MQLRIDPAAAPAGVLCRVGAQLYNPDGSALVKVSNMPTPIPSPYGVLSGTTAYRVLPVRTGGVPYLALVRTSDATLSPLPAPADATPFTQADLDKATAAGYAAAKANAAKAVGGI